MTGTDIRFFLKRIVVVQMMETEEIKERRIQKEEAQRKQIEEWTGLKYVTILFDSDIDDCSTEKVFKERVMGKKQIVLIVEDFRRNKFGGYLNRVEEEVYLYEIWRFVPDTTSFFFSLESNGRLPQMTKITAFDECCADDICEEWIPFIFFENEEILLLIYQFSKRYLCEMGIKEIDQCELRKLVTGTDADFTPKRCVVIQMV